MRSKFYDGGLSILVSFSNSVEFIDIVRDFNCTADGTWQRWGHSSKIGVVFVISVRTGEVLDYKKKIKKFSMSHLSEL